MLKVDFFEYRPVCKFEKTDSSFWFDIYFGNDIYLGDDVLALLFDDEEREKKHPEMFHDGQTMRFLQSGHNPEFSYRGFRIILFDCCLYIASADLNVGWFAEAPNFSSVDEMIAIAEEFIDGWHFSQLSPGQLRIPNIDIDILTRLKAR